MPTVDYFAVLSRAVMGPEAQDAQWRRGLYDRARQMLSDQMRGRQPPATEAEIVSELSELNAAIGRIESQWSKPQRRRIATMPQIGTVAWVTLTIAVAALGAGGYTLWATHRPAVSVTASPPNDDPQRRAAATIATEKGGALKPGVDGGSSDSELPYVFQRQMVFYRTSQPAGTIIIDKLQHYLYLIRPNTVAIRYGIGIGTQCTELAGLNRIAAIAEWPQWQPPPEMIARKLAKPGVLAGGPGNPLGARLLQLDDGQSSIHGTNAPKTIGTDVALGCIRLVNEDVVDLANRVQIGTRVVVD